MMALIPFSPTRKYFSCLFMGNSSFFLPALAEGISFAFAMEGCKKRSNELWQRKKEKGD